MSTFLKSILLGLSISAISAAAMAHPHNTDGTQDKERTEDSEPAKKGWPYFGGSEQGTAKDVSKKLEERFELHSKRLEKSLDKMRTKMNDTSDGSTAQDLRAAAEAMDDLFADSEMFTELADMVTGLADDFEMEDEADGTKVFLFDGKEMGRFKRETNKNDRMNIGGLGQNLTIERETYVKDGKTKTRIVIEMDGGEDVEIDLPAIKDRSDKE